MITPVLRALRETFPQARITVVVNSGTEAMLSGNPEIDEVLVNRRGASRGLRRLWDEFQFLKELRRRRFDVTIGFTEGDRAAWYSFLCRARYSFGMVRGPKDFRTRAYRYPLLPPRKNMHEVEKHFAMLRNAGVELRNQEPGPLCLNVSAEARRWARSELAALRPARIVHVHPVSRWLLKCWSDDSMAKVIDWLQIERGARVVVTTGPVAEERARAREVIKLCQMKPRFYDGTISLAQTAAIAAESDGYFGVDTAPMHMAAAVGVPVVALFGPTHSVNWGPWTPLGCALSKRCPCNEGPKGQKCDWSTVRACLAATTVAEAQAALDEMLARRALASSTA